MSIIDTHQAIDTLLDQWKHALEADYLVYRNHVYRVFNISCTLSGARKDDREKLALAAAFHDVGIWLDHTFDYLEPSAQRATKHLIEIGRPEWTPILHDIISQHHKVFPWHGPEQKLVESFRQADWLDVCFFALPTGLERSFLSRVLQAFPRHGFQTRLLTFTLQRARQHPLNPLPMFKW